MDESKEDTISIQNTNNNVIESDEDNDCCPICLDDFEEEKMKYLTCGCGTSTCINCSKEYLLQSTKEPHCHKCHRGWDRNFQYDNFGKNWINNIYKKKRKGIILEKEISLMPETMPFVEKKIKIQEIDKKSKLCNIEINNLIQKINNAKCNNNKELIRNLKQKINVEKEKKNDLYYEKRALDYGSVDVVSKKQFIKPCPAEDCRGFLSSSYKCGLCKIFVCPKCFEIIGLNKNNEHTCKQSNIDAATMIKKETKPCPKCGVPIFKIYGCSQMWCTICHISFSWITGRIQVGNIHNPHYHEWKKQQDSSINPTDGAAASAEFDPCQGVLSQDNFIKTSNKIKDLIPDSDYNHIHNVNQQIHHLRFILRNLKAKLNVDNTDLRVKYLMKDIDDKQLSKTATQRYNIREKRNSMHQILELIDNVITEQYRDFHTTITNIFKKYDSKTNIEHYVKNSCKNLFESIQNIRNYSNNELIKISINYNMKVYFISPIFYINEYRLVHHSDLCKLLIIEKNTNCIDTYNKLILSLFGYKIKHSELTTYIDYMIQLYDILTIDNYNQYLWHIVCTTDSSVFSNFIELIINLFYKTEKSKKLTNQYINNSKNYYHQISVIHGSYRNSNLSFNNLQKYLIDIKYINE